MSNSQGHKNSNSKSKNRDLNKLQQHNNINLIDMIHTGQKATDSVAKDQATDGCDTTSFFTHNTHLHGSRSSSISFRWNQEDELDLAMQDDQSYALCNVHSKQQAADRSVTDTWMTSSDFHGLVGQKREHADLGRLMQELDGLLSKLRDTDRSKQHVRKSQFKVSAANASDLNSHGIKNVSMHSSNSDFRGDLSPISDVGKKGQEERARVMRELDDLLRKLRDEKGNAMQPESVHGDATHIEKIKDWVSRQQQQAAELLLNKLRQLDVQLDQQQNIDSDREYVPSSRVPANAPDIATNSDFHADVSSVHDDQTDDELDRLMQENQKILDQFREKLAVTQQNGTAMQTHFVQVPDRLIRVRENQTMQNQFHPELRGTQQMRAAAADTFMTDRFGVLSANMLVHEQHNAHSVCVRMQRDTLCIGESELRCHDIWDIAKIADCGLAIKMRGNTVLLEAETQEVRDEWVYALERGIVRCEIDGRGFDRFYY